MTKLVYPRVNFRWTRDYCKGKPNRLFIFGDNTDRSSGANLIPADRPYCKKYGQGKKFPNVTSACIRGLENAMPISTSKYYHFGATYEKGRWNDTDLDKFVSVIDDEINEIKNYILRNNPTHVVFPANGLLNSKISNISPERCPKIYDALKSRLDQLEQFIEQLS